MRSPGRRCNDDRQDDDEYDRAKGRAVPDPSFAACSPAPFLEPEDEDGPPAFAAMASDARSGYYDDDIYENGEDHGDDQDDQYGAYYCVYYCV